MSGRSSWSARVGCWSELAAALLLHGNAYVRLVARRA